MVDSSEFVFNNILLLFYFSFLLFAGPAIVCPDHLAPVLPDVTKPRAVTQHVPPEYSNPVAQVPAIPPVRAAALVPQMPVCC